MLRFPLIFVGITQEYSKFHTAIDMGWNNSWGGKNANIYASGNGYVTKIVNGKNNTLIPNQSGNYIDIYYPLENLTVRVCHLLKNSIKVKINEKVTKDYAFKNNYWWDLINYNGELVYVPNKWNKYLQN